VTGSHGESVLDALLALLRRLRGAAPDSAGGSGAPLVH
jgi:hypothetical protein